MLTNTLNQHLLKIEVGFWDVLVIPKGHAIPLSIKYEIQICPDVQ